VPNRKRVTPYGVQLVIPTMLITFGNPHGQSVWHHLARIAINGRKYELLGVYPRDDPKILERMYPMAQKTVHIGMAVLLVGIKIGSTKPDALRRKMVLFVLRTTGSGCQHTQQERLPRTYRYGAINSCHIVAKLVLTSALRAPSFCNVQTFKVS